MHFWLEICYQNNQGCLRHERVNYLADQAKCLFSLRLVHSSNCLVITPYAALKLLTVTPANRNSLLHRPTCILIPVRLKLEIQIFSKESNCIFIRFIRVLCISNSTPLSCLQKFEEALGSRLQLLSSPEGLYTYTEPRGFTFTLNGT